MKKQAFYKQTTVISPLWFTTGQVTARCSIQVEVTELWLFEVLQKHQTGWAASVSMAACISVRGSCDLLRSLEYLQYQSKITPIHPKNQRGSLVTNQDSFNLYISTAQYYENVSNKDESLIYSDLHYKSAIIWNKLNTNWNNCKSKM